MHRTDDRPEGRRLDQVLRAIEETRLLRDAADPEDFSTRLDLKERMRELEIEASQLRTRLRSPASIDQARRELADIERQLEEIDRSHLDVVRQAGGGSAGGDFAFATDAHRLNRQIDEAAGRGPLERRARELRRWIEQAG